MGNSTDQEKKSQSDADDKKQKFHPMVGGGLFNGAERAGKATLLHHDRHRL